MIPPVHLALGAAIGAVGTYVYKDDSAREKLTATGGKVKEGVSSGIGYVTGLFKKAPEVEAEVEAQAEIQAETQAEAEAVVEEKAAPDKNTVGAKTKSQKNKDNRSSSAAGK
ncbi:MAG: hypothetical protein GKR96_12685 [Gammaproteobacteria bacterium]|nr:hypothetical protein [Gammaproteobacteria bacterium]